MYQIKYPPLTDDYVNRIRGVLPDGRYRFICKNGTFSHAKSSGNPQMILKIELKDEVSGRAVNHVHYMSFTEKMLPQVKNFFDSIGEPQKALQGGVSESDFYMKSGECITKMGKDMKGFDRMQIVDFVKSDLLVTNEIKIDESSPIAEDDLGF